MIAALLLYPKGLFPCVSEAAAAALGVGQFLHLDDFGLLASGNDHLGNALAVVDDEVLIAEVDEDDAYFASVVGVDGAGAVQHGDALLQRQAAAGPRLRLVARRQLHEEARLHEPSFHRLQRNRSLGQISAEVHACRLRGLVLRQRMVTAVDYLYLHSCHALNSPAKIHIFRDMSKIFFAGWEKVCIFATSNVETRQGAGGRQRHNEKTLS